MRKLFLILIFAIISPCLAQKVLHISTIPSNADVYVGDLHPDCADKPDYISPAFIKVNEIESLHGEVLVHLFHPDFRDSTIRVRLSNRDTSFLVVSLQPIYDDILLEEQQKIIGKRGRRVVGKKLMIASAVPFLAGGISSLATLYYINQAKDVKKEMEQARIKDPDHYAASLNEFKESKDHAKTAKAATITSLAVGAAIFTVGFIFSF